MEGEDKYHTQPGEAQEQDRHHGRDSLLPLNRRVFLKSAAASSLAATTVTLAGCSDSNQAGAENVEVTVTAPGGSAVTPGSAQFYSELRGALAELSRPWEQTATGASEEMVNALQQELAGLLRPGVRDALPGSNIQTLIEETLFAFQLLAQQQASFAREQVRADMKEIPSSKIKEYYNELGYSVSDVLDRPYYPLFIVLIQDLQKTEMNRSSEAINALQADADSIHALLDIYILPRVRKYLPAGSKTPDGETASKASLARTLILLDQIAQALANTAPATPTPEETETETAEEETETETTAVQGWPQFQVDAQNTGHHPSTTGPKRDIQAKWQFEVGAAVKTAPVVQDGTVYVNADRLYALDVSDGSVEWTFRPSGGGSSPAVANGTVYVGGSGKHVYAVNASDGTEKWRKPLGGSFTAPTIKGKKGFIVLEAGGNYSEGHLAAFELETGSILWTVSERGLIDTPVVGNGNVYVQRDSKVFAYSTGDGSLNWGNQHTNGPILFPLTLVGDRLFGHSAGRKVVVFDASSGKLTKPDQLNLGRNKRILTSPAATSSALYVGTDDNNMYSLSPSEGVQWSFETGGAIGSDPALADGGLYFGSDDGYVYAVDAASGEQLWRFTTGDSVRSPPAVVNGAVYVGSLDGFVYALVEKS